jgi:predicted nucleic acid-binding protein
MNRLAFFDTNIFVYADDVSAPAKQARAIQLITEYRRSDLLVVSIQVLQEYYAAATGKLGVDPETAQQCGFRRSRTAFRREVEQHSGLKSNGIPG